MKAIITIFTDHWIELAGLLLAYFGIILPLIQYLNRRKKEEQDKRFINFHRLVKELVEPDTVTNRLMLDRQIAIVFEFRNYSDYFDLIERMLNDLRDQWKDTNKRLLTEIRLTLAFIKYNRTFFLFRVFKHKP